MILTKELRHGEEGRKTATQPEPAFGWVLIGWVLGRSVSCDPDGLLENRFRAFRPK